MGGARSAAEPGLAGYWIAEIAGQASSDGQVSTTRRHLLGMLHPVEANVADDPASVRPFRLRAVRARANRIADPIEQSGLPGRRQAARDAAGIGKDLCADAGLARKISPWQNLISSSHLPCRSPPRLRSFPAVLEQVASPRSLTHVTHGRFLSRSAPIPLWSHHRLPPRHHAIDGKPVAGLAHQSGVPVRRFSPPGALAPLPLPSGVPVSWNPMSSHPSWFPPRSSRQHGPPSRRAILST